VRRCEQHREWALFGERIDRGIFLGRFVIGQRKLQRRTDERLLGRLDQRVYERRVDLGQHVVG